MPSQLALGTLLHSVFEQADRERGICIGFTSATASEGVSFITEKIADQLTEEMGDSVLLVSSAQFRDPAWMRPSPGALRMTRGQMFSQPSPAEQWREKVALLRSQYRYAIVDCPALAVSSDALALAPHLDGIVVVVEANATSSHQIAHIERQLQMVNGKLLGFVLNKRRYLIPEWLFKVLH